MVKKAPYKNADSIAVNEDIVSTSRALENIFQIVFVGTRLTDLFVNLDDLYHEGDAF